MHASNSPSSQVHPIPETHIFLRLTITVLCYWGIAFYFLVAAIHTFSYALHGGTPLLNRFPRPLQALHSLLHTTITTYPILVTIVFWSCLFDQFDSTYSVWSNTSEHFLNTVFALFEISFSRVNPAPWIHLWWLIIILALYLSLAYLTHYTKGVYVYRFLDPAPIAINGDGFNVGGIGNQVGAYVMGIMAGVVITFCVVRGLVWLRKWGVETRSGKHGEFFAGRDLGCGDVELDARRGGDKPIGT